VPTRIGRKAAAAARRYRALPPPVRERFEEGLRNAHAALEVSADLPAELRADLLGLVWEMVGALVGDSMEKVRVALREEWPELYVHLADVLAPRKGGGGGAAIQSL
jgi:hypothetical protein